VAAAAGRSRGGAAVLGLALLLAGCATAPPRPGPALAPGSDAEAPELLRRWEAAWEGFSGLIAAAEVTVRSPERTDRSAAVLLVGPRALRVEVATPFGLPGLVAVAGPERLTVFRPLEREATVGPVSPEAIARWIGLALPLDALLRLLAGLVPTPPPGVPVEVEDEGGPHLAWRHQGLTYRVWVTPARQPGRLRVEGSELLTATFIRTVTGDVQSLALEAPQRRTEFLVAYRSVEPANPTPEAFELTVPAGVRIVPID
jgi:hypothetical protein